MTALEQRIEKFFNEEKSLKEELISAYHQRVTKQEYLGEYVEGLGNVKWIHENGRLSPYNGATFHNDQEGAYLDELSVTSLHSLLKKIIQSIK